MATVLLDNRDFLRLNRQSVPILARFSFRNPEFLVETLFSTGICVGKWHEAVPIVGQIIGGKKVTVR